MWHSSVNSPSGKNDVDIQTEEGSITFGNPEELSRYFFKQTTSVAHTSVLEMNLILNFSSIWNYVNFNYPKWMKILDTKINQVVLLKIDF